MRVTSSAKLMQALLLQVCALALSSSAAPQPSSTLPVISYVPSTRALSSHLSSTWPTLLPSTDSVTVQTVGNISITVSNEASTSSSIPNEDSRTQTTHTVPALSPLATPDPTITLMKERRLSLIVGNVLNPILLDSVPPSQIAPWLQTIDATGKWPDSEVDYTTGCDAARALWPAYWHWQRLLVMSAAWHGGLQYDGAEQWVGNVQLRTAIDNAMAWWFARDFMKLDCLVEGGTSACPCGTPGLWNTNWFSNTILVPNIVSQVCLMIDTPPTASLPRLSASQLGNCTRIILRSYGTFDHGYGFSVGANTLDMAKAGIDEGLLVGNLTMLSDAYRRIHNEVTVQTKFKADGIRPDGSFGQHVGLIYNGNYGKDYLNDVLDLELTAASTQYAANATSIKAVETLVDGDTWMVYENSETGVVHWDTSVVPRFIMFPVVDDQATARINLNLTKVGVLGDQWNSKIMQNFATSLSASAGDGNAGSLVGDRVFYINDYMVHRGKTYVSTLRMFSSRTINTECLNSQNLLGFHLSDGTRYTYVTGAEYEDIFAAWDWNLIPGTTTDYGNTPLSCSKAQQNGIEAFVGGVTTGDTGIGVMRYTNPLTMHFGFQKAWFFLEGDREHVMVSNVRSNSSAPVFSVLDQKKLKGAVLVDGKDISQHSDWAHGGSTYTSYTSLWHNNVGYVFPRALPGAHQSTLVVKVGDRFGNWSTIGTSSQPPYTVDLFASYLHHQANASGAFPSLSYTTLPAISAGAFSSLLKSSNPIGLWEIQNDRSVSAVYDESRDRLYAVFWDSRGASLGFSCPDGSHASIASSANLAVILDVKKGSLTVSDPGQSLVKVQISLAGACVGGSRKLTVQLPAGVDLGRSTTTSVHA